MGTGPVGRIPQTSVFGCFLRWGSKSQRLWWEAWRVEGSTSHGSSHELPAPPTPLIHSTAAPPSLDPPAASPAPGPSVGAQLCNLDQASADAHPSRLGGHKNYCGFLSTLVSPACGRGFQLALHLLHFTSVFPSQLLPGPGASSSSITQEDSMFAETTEWAPTLPEVRSQGQSHCCPSVSPSSWFCSSVHGLYRWDY